MQKFKDAKRRVITALQDGNYEIEARNNIDEKNLLAIGQVTAEDLIKLIKRCSGIQHSCSLHHTSSKFLVHVMNPSGWYIKFYFLDDSDGSTVFISVHK